jgi:hypothetical protein
VEATQFRTTRVVLAAAHIDSDPTNNRMKNLRALCQRCHMLHDRSHHLAQRWITYRRRVAIGDLFLGPYPALIVTLTELTRRRSNSIVSGKGPHGAEVFHAASLSRGRAVRYGNQDLGLTNPQRQLC